MDFRIADLYICPTCYSSMLLEVRERKGQEILDGSFSCTKCARNYTIQDGIPIFWQIDGKSETFSKDDMDEVLSNTAEDLQEKVIFANQIHHDRFAKIYEADPHVEKFLEEGTATQSRIHEVINYISTNSRMHLFLDVGCGTGNVLKLARQVFDIAIGVDVSIEMLRIAQQRGMQVCLASSDHLPFRVDSVDAISCFSVLHHLVELKPTFCEFFRVLIEDGYLYTDWDPSRTARQMEEHFIRSRMYGILIPFYRLIRNSITSTQRNDSIVSANHPDSIEMLAEFHNFYSQGLDAAQVKDILSMVGFQTQIYCHNDFPSLLNGLQVPLKSRIRLGVKFWIAFQHLHQIKTAFPILATLSRKRAATVSSYEQG